MKALAMVEGFWGTVNGNISSMGSTLTSSAGALAWPEGSEGLMKVVVGARAPVCMGGKALRRTTIALGLVMNALVWVAMMFCGKADEPDWYPVIEKGKAATGAASARWFCTAHQLRPSLGTASKLTVTSLRGGWLLREPRGIVLAPDARCTWALQPSRPMASKEFTRDSGSIAC